MSARVLVSGGVARPASTRALVSRPLIELWAEWLASLRGVLDVETLETYEVTYVGRHWPTHYSTLVEMTSELARERYRTARLQGAVAQTVKKEVWAQDKFLRWCKAANLIASVPPRLEWDKRTLGTRTGTQRRKAVELTPGQVQSILAELPEWREVGPRALEHKPFPIRDRFVVAYETSLRPATLSALLWGDLLAGRRLRIRDEADKIRFGRDVPLSDAAVDAFVRVRAGSVARGRSIAPDARIFGAHLYRKTLAAAVRRAGLVGVAPYDFRHARATHLADAGASLPGLGHLLGHRRASTTSVYLHGSMRAAEVALSRSESDTDLDAIEESQGDRRVSNPRQLEPQGGALSVDSGSYIDDTPHETAGKSGGQQGNRVPDLKLDPGLVDAVRTAWAAVNGDVTGRVLARPFEVGGRS